MRIVVLFLFISSVFTAGCKRPEENPHLLDPIYIDLVQSKAEIDSLIAKEEKDLQAKKEELRKVAPQSGLLQTARKHVWESQNRLYLLKQRQIYIKVRIESQLDKSHEGYMRSFYSGSQWPNPEDKKAYLLEKPANGLEPRNKSWSYKTRKPSSAPNKGPPSGH